MNGRDGAPTGPARRAAWIAIVLTLLATYLAFAKGLPFSSEYRIDAIVSTTNQLREGGEVRISGLRVGEVAGIEAGEENTSRLTLRIDDREISIRRDATISVRPRLPLEGGYYVELRPGTPGAPELDDGGTIPLEQTRVPVQLDQVLSVFDSPTRDSLHNSFAEMARGLGRGADGSGVEGLRRAAREFDGALEAATTVADAARGLESGDLPRATANMGEFSAQLAESPEALSALISNYNSVFSALSGADRDFGAVFRELGDVMEVAPSRLRALDAALPSLRRFSVTVRPTLDEAPEALEDMSAALHQLDLAVRPRELPRLLAALGPVTRQLPTLNRRVGVLFPFLSSAMQCVSQNIVPVLNDTIEDGPHTSGQPVWQEFLHMTAGLAGIAQGFDGNGSTLRLGVSEDQRVATFNLPGFGKVAARGGLERLAPTWLGFGVDPPYRPDAPCTSQDVANVNVESRKIDGTPPGFTFAEAPPATLERKLRAQLLAGQKGEVLQTLKKLVDLRYGDQIAVGRDGERGTRRRRETPAQEGREAERPPVRGEAELPQLDAHEVLEALDHGLKPLDDLPQVDLGPLRPPGGSR